MTTSEDFCDDMNKVLDEKQTKEASLVSKQTVTERAAWQVCAWGGSGVHSCGRMCLRACIVAVGRLRQILIDW